MLLYEGKEFRFVALYLLVTVRAGALVWFIQKSLFSLNFGKSIFSCLKAVTAAKIKSEFLDWILRLTIKKNKSFATRYMFYEYLIEKVKVDVFFQHLHFYWGVASCLALRKASLACSMKKLIFEEFTKCWSVALTAVTLNPQLLCNDAAFCMDF